jgi:N-acetylglutamate synthase-like GNAT family acetyltransferase
VPVRITRFEPRWSHAVAELIVPIQRDEFGIAITYAEQADLADIPGFYQRGAGEFWLAIDEAEAVVGSIALLDIGEGDGALRKMFVRYDERGAAVAPGGGVAERLLRTLVEHARSHGLRRIWLGTTDKFLAAHRFYEKHGFERVDPASLPESFPRMRQDTRFYGLTLKH